MDYVWHSKLYGLCATPLHDIQVYVLSKIVERLIFTNYLQICVLEIELRTQLSSLYSSLIIYQILPLISKSSADQLLNSQDIEIRQIIVYLYTNIQQSKDYESVDARNNIIFKSNVHDTAATSLNVFKTNTLHNLNAKTNKYITNNNCISSVFYLTPIIAVASLNLK